MILKALYDYYNRCGNLPAPGMELKELSFIIVIDTDGKFVRLEDRRIDNKTAQKFLVPKGIGRSSAHTPNFLWDNPAYVLGISDANFPYDSSRLNEEKKEKKEKDRENERAKNIKCHKTFVDLVDHLAQKYPKQKDIKSLQKFYEDQNILEKIKKDPLWPDFQKNLIKNISFLIDGDSQILPEKKELFTNDFKKEQKSIEGYCLVTGEKADLIETTSATSIQGSQATAKLVSFQVSSGYDSYGKKKGFNAPISKDAEFKYTTALRSLLEKDSRNKFFVGSRTFVFWASSKDDSALAVENSVFNMFGLNGIEDDPNKNIENVKKVMQAIYSGNLKTTLDDKFYILGLSPNSARIAVSYWKEQPLRQFAGMILHHFDNMNIVDTRKEKKPYVGLRTMLSAVTLCGKSSDVTPNLSEEIIKSIFEGVQYPYTLFTGCIRRIRAESGDNSKNPVNIARAGIIKAYLNRINDNNKNIQIMLDKENRNLGYLCGRLFATLEKIQEDANNIHSIRERYMNAASSTPSTVFATILNLSVHHAEKLNKSKQIYYEKMKQDIIDKLPANGFPSHLTLQDQGRFFVGYYQQRQDFFTKKESCEEEIQ